MFGSTTLIKSKDWDGTEFEWVQVTAENEPVKGRKIIMPLGMLISTKYMETLEGYFPIYAADSRPLGKVESKGTITVPRKPKRTPEEIRELEQGVAAAAAKAAAEAAVAEGGAAGAGGAGAGGMRGGGGGGMRGGGMRGGGGRGGRGGGMRGGGRGGGGM